MDTPPELLEWRALVEGVRRGDRAAIARFSCNFANSAGFLIRYGLGTDQIDNTLQACATEGLGLVQHGSLAPDQLPAALLQMVLERIAQPARSTARLPPA